MGGTLTRAIDMLDHHALAGDVMTSSGPALAIGSGATNTVVGLLVAIALPVAGWIIVAKHRKEDRAADIGNTDLAELITALSDVDVEARRIADLPHPADAVDYREIERLIPLANSLAAVFDEPLSILVLDVVRDARMLVTLPVHSTTPLGEYGPRVQQQTRAVDKLLDSTNKALASARRQRR
ncbi:hypothetical protein ACIRS3_35545 [Streptomyces virginiae]|uniref:hypothetical protein n=1 Tax=Streptomyces virginiae TaxID=1961 RepID=UPI0038039D91